MPFPFLPFGAVLAALVLGAAYAAFWGAVRLLDRAALAARHTIAPGVIAGLGAWTHAQRRDRVTSPGAVPDTDPSVEELAASEVSVEPVRRR